MENRNQFFCEKLENISCQYDRLNGQNSSTCKYCMPVNHTTMQCTTKQQTMWQNNIRYNMSCEGCDVMFRSLPWCESIIPPEVGKIVTQIIFFVKNWKTSAVSTSDWMIKTQVRVSIVCPLTTRQSSVQPSSKSCGRTIPGIICRARGVT